MDIRFERAADVPVIRYVNQVAFAGTFEADLVDALRAQARPLISLVADEAGDVVGHILFSPVTLSSAPERLVMGLAPMAVVPERQRQGIGTLLVTAGLSECRALGAAAVVVLGHPQFYPRFGFVPASRFGVTTEYDVPDDTFMALEIEPGALTPGSIRYHAAFGPADAGPHD
jgi:putative acetyltransferase